MALVKIIIQRSLLLLRDVCGLFGIPAEVTILCYHSVSDAPIDTAVTPQALDAQLRMLKRSGATFVPLERIVEWAAGTGELPHRAVALTFDDGYADFETNALPVLQRYNAPAMVFVVGDESAARTHLGNDIPLLSPEARKRLQSNQAITVGYHSTTHSNLARYAADALNSEVESSFGARFFAYPGGNHRPAVAEALRYAGYIAACTIGRDVVTLGTNPMYLPRTVITNNMSLWRVRFATTRALHWYRALSHVFR